MPKRLPKLWIVGAGGFGREVWSYAREHPENGVKWELTGFLDDHIEALDAFPHYPKVVARVRDFEPGAGDLFLNGIGQVPFKKQCAESIESRGGEFIRLIHPTASINGEIHWGKAGVICPGVILTTDITLGDHVLLNCQTTVGHDASIGHYTTLSSFCDVTGGVQVGEEVFAGSRVSMIPQVQVGNNAVLGAGSVVIRNLEGGYTYFGVPARKLIR